MGIEKIGHLIETIITSVRENGIEQHSPVVIRVGPEGPDAKFLPIECLAVRRTLNGLQLVIQAQNPS